ncbi:MAG: CBS domain-containing protein [Candidatus Paceibacteria bacterium]
MPVGREPPPFFLVLTVLGPRMKLSKIMTTQVVSIGPDDSLDVALALFDKHSYRHLPVIRGGALVSMISRRDLSAATGWQTAAERKALGQKGPLIVREIMRDRVVTLGPHSDVEAAASMMIGKRAGAIPILENNLIIGIVTSSDILAAIRHRNPQAEWGRTRDVSSVKVSEFMHRKPTSVESGADVAEAAGVCVQEDLRHLSVTDGGTFVGLVTDYELSFHHTQSKPVQASQTALSDVMVKDVITIGPDEELTAAADSMIENGLSGLPVVTNDGLVGFLTDQDVIQYFTAKFRVPPL